MGYHAWPTADAVPGATFTASLILGYTPTALIFIEPMITQFSLLEGRDFELAISAPKKSGGGRTRYPTRMRALYRDSGSTLALEFDQFVDLFIAAARELGVHVADQAEVRTALRAMRASVITEFKPNPAYDYQSKPF